MVTLINGFDMLMLSVLALLVGCFATLLLVLTSRWQETRKRKPDQVSASTRPTRPHASETLALIGNPSNRTAEEHGL